jgi:hypothetical protein
MIKNTGAKNVSDESGKNWEFDIFLISPSDIHIAKYNFGERKNREVERKEKIFRQLEEKCEYFIWIVNVLYK